jgi:hypothetical protein
MKLKWPLLILSGVVVAFFVTYVFHTEDRALDRLKQTRAVISVAGVKKLYSTGFLRENTHIFEVATSSLDLTRAYLYDSTDAQEHHYIERACDDLREYLQLSVDPESVKVYSLSSEKDGDGLLYELTVIKKPLGATWIIHRVF